MSGPCGHPDSETTQADPTSTTAAPLTFTDADLARILDTYYSTLDDAIAGMRFPSTHPTTGRPDAPSYDPATPAALALAVSTRPTSSEPPLAITALGPVPEAFSISPAPTPSAPPRPPLVEIAVEPTLPGFTPPIPSQTIVPVEVVPPAPLVTAPVELPAIANPNPVAELPR